MEWENVRDYHDFVFFCMEKRKFEELMNDESIPEQFKQILRDAREEYKNRNINKKWSSKVASKAKVNKAFKKCAIALYYMKNNLFDKEREITPYRLMKEAKVHFNTAKKFLETYKTEVELGEIESIFKELKIDISKL